MKDQFRQVAYRLKSGLFTTVIHGALVAALLAGLWWPFTEEKVDRGHAKPIQAQAITEQEIQQVVEQQQQKKAEEKKKAEEELAALQ